MAETQTKEKTYSFSVEGMTCASCVHIVERQLSKMEGIKYVSVNLATEKAYVISEPDKSFTDIQNTVEKTGYKAKKSEKGTDQTLVRFQKTQMDLIIALAITIPVMGLMIAHMTGVMIPGYLFVEILGGLAIFLTAGRGIVKSAGIALVHGHTNMDSLVSLGSFAAFLTAVLAAAGVDIASFGALAPMLIAFHMAGKYIEARLKYRASKDVRSLLDIQSKNARIATRDKGIVEMPLETVKPGAVCVVRTGERIPLDGKIIEGKGYTDESMITGEPVPVEKQKEDEVTGGTLLTSGSIRFEVTHVGEDTFLARMVKLVEEAQSAKVPIQAAADRVTLIFIPLVMTIAVIAGLFWGIGYDAFAPFLSWAQGFLPWVNPDAGALSTGIFVFVTALVIACPCALGLATPMGLVAGTGAAAKRGMIIKEGEAIQRAKDISTVVFDKTGTLTKGEPEVVESNADNEHLPIIAAIEAQSAHPLARAVISYTESQSVPAAAGVESITEHTGAGMTARYQGKDYFLGRPKEPAKYEQQMKQGWTVIELRVDDTTAGHFAIADTIKPEAEAAVSKLQDSGIKVAMLTGDNEVTANAIAEKLGISSVYHSVKPDEKVRIVHEMQIAGETVAMVGDGINDAAALKGADVGIALSTGTDLSIESGDIIITGDNLQSIYSAITISAITFRKIRGNLFWAFFYNIISIPLAVLGLLTPIIAEAAMTFSSINVIANSMGIQKKVQKEEV